MRELHIGIICEGTSDFEILNEIICNRLGKRQNCLPLQPQLNCFSPGGWGNVWKYCVEKISTIGFDEYIKFAGKKLDALVIALDGDCSREKTLYCDIHGKPSELRNIECTQYSDAFECYKARSVQDKFIRCEYYCQEHIVINDECLDERDTFIQSAVKHWLNIADKERPNELVFAIPIDSIDNWIVCALDGEYIEGVPIESYKDIFHNYIKKQVAFHGVNTSLNDLDMKKNIASRFKDNVCKNWGVVSRTCKQAKKFEEQLFMV